MGQANIPLNIAVVAEQQSSYLQLGYSEEDCAALTHKGEVHAVTNTLKQLGHNVTHVSGVQPLVQQLAAGNHKDWDMVFNMAQGFHGSARESQVPALLESYQIAYTFSDAATMALCQNKANTKIILHHHQIPTAPFLVVPAHESPEDFPKYSGKLPSYPLFLKPVTEGSSKGISDLNKVTEPAELEVALQKLSIKFPGQDILIESFLPGREYSISILGTGPACRVIGIRELIWQKERRSGSKHIEQDFATRKSKSSTSDQIVYNDFHDEADPEIQAASQVALAAWRVLGCRDAGRVDIRFDAHEPCATPNILEVNPISGLLPVHSPLPGSAESNGISYDQLLTGIIESTLQRIKKRNHGG
ncbi:hypothetical protein BJY01DRAFT_150895 [Aspergillus pseudoustus]|uniref:ATP-grasp domain-containing protein n=1 Tax=Aspergillus pseudoustus TaxID=1810923 RepID=A0ABR4K9E9_9EURO